ncbi:MAG: M23 family metallopeptidase [Arenimonas sp.]|jgi:murein DD-endopeptidase MepM/ murein hydrolase activator NlpD
MTMIRAGLLLTVLALALVALLAITRRAQPAGADSVASADPGAEAPGLQPQPIHELRNRNLGGGDEYLVRNLLAGPIEVRCALIKAENVASNPRLPRRLVVPARAEFKLTDLRSVEPTLPAIAEIECGAMVGDPNAPAPDGVSYAIPFYPGTKFTVDQGFAGAYSHHDPESRYSLDLGVPEGTPVIAARGGVVMQVEEDFRASGNDARRFGDRSNYVRVLHDDGSLALYAHLAPRTILFRPGDRIRTGNFLAKSGNTGFSTGPHLHFSVQKNAGFALRSIPFAMPGVDTSN